MTGEGTTNPWNSEIGEIITKVERSGPSTTGARDTTVLVRDGLRLEGCRVYNNNASTHLQHRSIHFTSMTFYFTF